MTPLPQMAPMNWLFLFTLFGITLTILTSKIHFLK